MRLEPLPFRFIIGKRGKGRIASCVIRHENVKVDANKIITTMKIKDEKKIEELKKELSKYGCIYEEEDYAGPQTNLHLIVKIPYKEIYSKGDE